MPFHQRISRYPGAMDVVRIEPQFEVGIILGFVQERVTMMMCAIVLERVNCE